MNKILGNKSKRKILGLFLMMALGWLTLFIFGGLSSPQSKDSLSYFALQSKQNFEALLKELSSSHIDIAGVDTHQKVIGVVINEHEKKYLDSTLFPKYQISVLDQRPMQPLALTLQEGMRDISYYNPNKIERDLKILQRKFPAISQLISIGKSFTEDHDLWALRIGVGIPNSIRPVKKPSLLFNGLHHAREVMTPEVVYDIGQYLLENYEKDANVTHWINNLDIWLVPMVNPDGSRIVFKENNLWRKNARSSFFSLWTFGVDLNRNYAYDWGGDSSSDSSFSNTYRGTHPLSEPEAFAMDNLNRKNHFAYSLSYHSFGEMILYPFSSRKKNSTEEDTFRDLAQNMASRLITDTGLGYTYTYGKTWEILYPVGGSDDDHHYANYGTLAFTIETNSWPRNFQPSYREWRDKEVQIQRPAWMFLMERALNGPALVLTFVNGLTKQPLMGEVRILEIPHRHGEKPLSSNEAGFFYHALMPATYHLEIRSEGRASIFKTYEVKDVPVFDRIVL